jgi:hypothetical protein
MTETQGQDSDSTATQENEISQPPEEEWLTHGGYLGCLLAMVFGCLLAAFIATPLIRGTQLASIQNWGVAFTISAIFIMIVGISLFGWIGWKIGKRIFREYPQPQRDKPEH